MAIIERKIENLGSNPPFAFVNFIRILGIVLIFVGIYFGYQVIDYAWKLLQDPQLVATFSEKIESHSKLNANLKNFLASGIDLEMNQAGTNQPIQATLGGKSSSQIEFNITYFLGWSITLILLGIIGNLSCKIIVSGAKIAASSDYSAELGLLIKRLAQK